MNEKNGTKEEFLAYVKNINGHKMHVDGYNDRAGDHRAQLEAGWRYHGHDPLLDRLIARHHELQADSFKVLAEFHAEIIKRGEGK